MKHRNSEKPPHFINNFNDNIIKMVSKSILVMWIYNLSILIIDITFNTINNITDTIPIGNKAENINVPSIDFTPGEENQGKNEPIK